ncbi:MAG: hypothetical protein CR975_02770 [Gammaproteobacteria bacterium]|nr:MAG: hypothetical protein CR975_02770 [Gammaproteobacteria bacterium]
MGNKAKNLLAILCLIFVVSACSDEKPDDTERSKPTASTDKRCQKDTEKGSEKNEEDEVDCVVVNNKKPDTPDKSDDSKLKGQDLWNKYAPKECYESIISSGTMHVEAKCSNGYSINDGTFTHIITSDSDKLSMSGKATTEEGTCPFSSTELHFKGRTGSYSGHICGQPLSNSTTPKTNENHCVGKAGDYSIIKLDKLNGKEVLYTEYQEEGWTDKAWYNLKPFYRVKEVQLDNKGGCKETGTWIHTNVKINEPIDDKVFALPKK